MDPFNASFGLVPLLSSKCYQKNSQIDLILNISALKACISPKADLAKFIWLNDQAKTEQTWPGLT